MQCKNCGTMVPDGRERCHYCNAPMPPVGPAPVKPPKAAVRACTCCGKDLTEGDKFCKYCGTDQEAEPVIKSGDKMTDLFLRLCPNCGMEIKNDDQYCAGCGQEVKHSKRKSSMSPGRVLGIVACVIIVVLVTILIVRLVTNTPEAVAKDFVKAMYYHDEGEIFDLYPPERMEQLMEENDLKESEYENIIESKLDSTHDWLVSSFGENWEVTIHSAIKGAISESEWQNYMRIYQRYDIDIEDVDKVYLSVGFSGECGKQWTPEWITVVKIDGRWYVDPDQYSLLSW